MMTNVHFCVGLSATYPSLASESRRSWVKSWLFWSMHIHHARTHARTHTRARVGARAHTHTHTHTHARTHARTHSLTHARTHARTHTHTHTHTHARTHARTHTQRIIRRVKQHVLLYFTFVYRLYHFGSRGKKETFVCCTSECRGRRDVLQR